MHYIDSVRSIFSYKPFFSRKDLMQCILKIEPDLKESTFDWLVYRLCQQNIIRRVAYNTYTLYSGDSGREKYKEDYSAEATLIKDFLAQRFPLLTYAVWETRSLNEFVNHQMARNFILVEVEKPLEESVFEALREQFDHTILYKPSAKEIAMYANATTVCVLSLVSEAPIEEHSVALEKMLVDLFANRLLGQIMSPNEYAGVYEEAFAKYQINISVLFRYAKRRTKDKIIREFMAEKTRITLN